MSFASVAVSGGAAVADAQGDASVFNEPAGGWGTTEPSATLTDSDGGHLGTLAASGATVAALASFGSASDYAPQQGQVIDVFSKPPAGWSGRVGQTARLIPSDGALLSAVAVSGSTVVAAGFGRNNSAAYVFTERVGGWSGTLHETARLRLPQNVYPRSVSIDGRGVVVDGAISGSTVIAQGKAYLFSEPAGGWLGSVPVTATLASTYYDAAVFVYRQPPQGWTGVVHPVARLLLSAPGGYPGELAVSGDQVAVAAYAVPGKYGGCPCAGGIWLFAKPQHGWQGTLTAPVFTGSATDQGGNIALSLDGSILFAGGQTISGAQETNLSVFQFPSQVTESQMPAGRPTVTNQHLGGLVNGRPKLTFNVQAGMNAPPIKSVTVIPPRGLTFVADTLASGVTIQNKRAYLAHVVRGKLIVSLQVPLSALGATLRWPALVESKSLLKRIHKLQRLHPGKASKQVFKTIIELINADGRKTRLLLKTTLR